jgi:hypothetical protein
MIHVGLTEEIWVEPGDAEAIEATVARRGLASPCAPSGSSLADALAALKIGPSTTANARFPLVECQHVNETTDVWVTTSSGSERRARNPGIAQRIIHLSWVVAVRADDEAVVEAYAANHYEFPISVESAVDDLVHGDYPEGWWDGCSFDTRDYGFERVTLPDAG